MFGPFVLTIPLTALVVWLLAALLVAPRRRRLARANEARYPGLAAQARRVQLVRGLSLLLAVLVAIFVAGTGQNGQGMAIAPATAGLVLVVGVLVGEMLGHSAARTPGVAGLESRRLTDYLPKGLTWCVALCTLATFAYFAWSTAVAAPDDRGNPGRVYAYGYDDRSVSGGFSPFPGSFYTGPMIAGLVLLIAMAATALLVVKNRPRDGSDPVLVASDDVLRVRAIESAIAGLGAGVGGTIAGAAGLVAGAMVPDILWPYPVADGVVMVPNFDAAPWFSLALALFGLVLALWCVAVLLMPGAGREPKAPSATEVELGTEP